MQFRARLPAGLDLFAGTSIPVLRTLASGQSAVYGAGVLYAVGPIGDTDELAFWTEYSSFPPEDRVCPGPGSCANFAEYTCTVNSPPAVPDPAFVFCTQCLDPADFMYPPSRNPAYDIVGGAAVLDLTIADEPSAAALLSAALGLLVLLRRRVWAVAT